MFPGRAGANDGRPTTKVTFVMEDTYPGTKFKDVCISEVTFDEFV